MAGCVPAPASRPPRVLGDVRPDLVVLNGDVIDGSPRSGREAAPAIRNVARPMEHRFASEYGIDLAPGVQPEESAPLPAPLPAALSAAVRELTGTPPLPRGTRSC